MAQLEPLNIRITGSSDGLSSALAKARGDTQRFAQGLGDSSERITGLFGAMGPAAAVGLGAIAAAGAAATAALALGVAKTREQFDVVDELSDAAAKLGVSFNELKGLRLAIGQATGMQAEQVDSAIAKLQLNLTEAALNGSGRVYDRIKSLGLDAKELIAEGPTEAIAAIAAKVSELRDPAEQMYVAFELFGKQGTDFVNALRGGPDALREIIEKTKENAGLTEAQVEAIGNSNDAWENLGVQVDAIFQKIAAEFAPMLEIIAGDAEDVAKWFKNIDGWARYAVGTLAELYGIALDLYELLTLSDGAFAVDGADKVRERLKEIRERNAEAGDEPKVSEAALAALEAQQKASEEAAAAAEKAAEEWNKRAESLRNSLATPLEKYQSTVDELRQAMDKGGLEWEIFARGVAKAANELEKAQGAASSLGEPKLLSAVTDRAAQIRLAAQLALDNQKRDRDREQLELLKAQLATEREMRDLMKKQAGEEKPDPPPINL